MNDQPVAPRSSSKVGDNIDSDTEARLIDQITASFARAWKQAPPVPLIDEYLDLGVVNRAHLLKGLVQVDLEQRLTRKESPRVEHYLAQYPELAGSPTRIVEFAVLEQRIRLQLGEEVEVEEYLRRFPDVAAALKAASANDIIRAPTDQTSSSLNDSSDETSELSVAEYSAANLAGSSATIGKYRVIRGLGGGGQGTTWLVHDPDLDCRVVLKRYHQSGPDAEYYLRLEARALAKVQSPYVARCLHVDRIHADLFLVMDYIQGDPLTVYVRREQTDFRRIAELLAEIAQGLLDVHNAGLLHRDIKPANILVRRNGTPCLVDFGLAMQLGADADEQVAGTAPYMSPEQARRDALRPSSDVFGLGAVMYELLTGVRPYSGHSRSELLEMAKKAAFQPPLELNPDIPESLAAICLKAMAPEQSHRYATADTFRAALCDYLDPKLHTAVGRNARSAEQSMDLAELGPNPYKGLAAFTETDSERFFGRELLIDRLWRAYGDLHRARSAQTGIARILPLLGPSGCGKSSVARAGLVARLVRHPIPAQEMARFCVVTPGSRPLETLALELARLATGDAAPAEKAAEFERILRAQTAPDRCDGLRRLIDMLCKMGNSSIILLVDQFEELYSLCPDESERRQYIDNLFTGANDVSGRLSVILTLRSDFLAATQDHEALNQLIAQHGVIVPAMNKEELYAAIAEPAKRAGRPLDDGIIELLIAATRDHEGALPLLQFALALIWEGLRVGKSPARTLQEIGGVGGALAGEAQRIYESLSTPEQHIARRAFLAMIQLGEGTKDMRRRARLDSVATVSEDVRRVREVVSRFAEPGVRIVSLSADSMARPGEPIDTMEVTHEALFDHWQTLGQWLDRSRDDIRLHRRLEDAALRWKELGRPTGLLWRPPDLDLLNRFHQHNPDELPQNHLDFLLACRRQNRIQRMLRGMLLTLIMLLILAFGMTLVFVRQGQRRRETLIADTLSAARFPGAFENNAPMIKEKIVELKWYSELDASYAIKEINRRLEEYSNSALNDPSLHPREVSKQVSSVLDVAQKFLPELPSIIPLRRAAAARLPLSLDLRRDLSGRLRPARSSRLKGYLESPKQLLTRIALEQYSIGREFVFSADLFVPPTFKEGFTIILSNGAPNPARRCEFSLRSRNSTSNVLLATLSIDNTVVRQHAFKDPGRSLSIQAERNARGLRFTIGEQHLDYYDMFPFFSEPAKLTLQIPPDVAVGNPRLTYRTHDPSLSELDQINSRVARKDYSGALAILERTLRDGKTAEARWELEMKRALCQIRLQATSSSGSPLTVLEDLATRSSERLSIYAAGTLVSMAMENRDSKLCSSYYTRWLAPRPDDAVKQFLPTEFWSDILRASRGLSTIPSRLRPPEGYTDLLDLLKNISRYAPNDIAAALRLQTAISYLHINQRAGARSLLQELTNDSWHVPSSAAVDAFGHSSWLEILDGQVGPSVEVVVNNVLKRRDLGTNDRLAIFLDLARVCAAKGDVVGARRNLESIIESRGTNSVVAESLLLNGLLLSRECQHEAAKVQWTKGYRLLHQTHNKAHPTYLMLGSLCGELTDQDVIESFKRNLELAGHRFLPARLLVDYLSAGGIPEIQQAVISMYQDERGREIAYELAFRTLSHDDFLARQAVLGIYNTIRIGAFRGKPEPDDDKFLWRVAEDAVKRWRTNEISDADLPNILLSWLLRADPVLLTRVKVPMRQELAYVLGNYYLNMHRLGTKPSLLRSVVTADDYLAKAVSYLKVASSTNDEELKELADGRLKEIQGAATDD